MKIFGHELTKSVDNLLLRTLITDQEISQRGMKQGMNIFNKLLQNL